MKPYFKKKFGTDSNLYITKNYYENDGSTPTTGANSTEIEENAEYIEFLINMKTLVSQAREQEPAEQPVIMSSTLDTSKSSAAYEQGDRPITGKWRLKMKNPAGEAVNSTDLSHGDADWKVTQAMEQKISEYYTNLKGDYWRLYDENGRENGYKYIISFENYRKAVD